MQNTFKVLIFGCALALIAGCSPPQLMPYKQFSKLKLALPKTLVLNAAGKKLVYVGTYHTNNPQDSLFDQLQLAWKTHNPDFILHEGGDWPIYQDEDSTIAISGEPGFMIRTASRHNIAYRSIEPAETEEMAYLLESYSQDWVVLMYVCRQIDQQQRLARAQELSDEAFEKNMDHFLAHLSTRGLNLTEDQRTFSHWQTVYAQLMGQPLEWRTFDPSLYYPNYYKTTLNAVNRQSDEFRNLHMVNTILQQLETHNKVMVVVGGGHLYVQEKLLKHRFKAQFGQRKKRLHR